MVPAGAARTPCLFFTRSFFCLFILSAVAARAQYSDQVPLATRSVSGQFVISAPARSAWFFNRQEITADTNLIRFDPALLAVSAERFKVLLWQQAGLQTPTAVAENPCCPAPGPSPEDEVTITSRFMTGNWDYQLTLPDIQTRARYAAHCRRFYCWKWPTATTSTPVVPRGDSRLAGGRLRPAGA